MLEYKVHKVSYQVTLYASDIEVSHALSTGSLSEIK